MEELAKWCVILIGIATLLFLIPIVSLVIVSFVAILLKFWWISFVLLFIALVIKENRK